MKLKPSTNLTLFQISNFLWVKPEIEWVLTINYVSGFCYMISKWTRYFVVDFSSIIEYRLLTFLTAIPTEISIVTIAMNINVIYHIHCEAASAI